MNIELEGQEEQFMDGPDSSKSVKKQQVKKTSNKKANLGDKKNEIFEKVKNKKEKYGKMLQDKKTRYSVIGIIAVLVIFLGYTFFGGKKVVVDNNITQHQNTQNTQNTQNEEQQNVKNKAKQEAIKTEREKEQKIQQSNDTALNIEQNQDKILNKMTSASENNTNEIQVESHKYNQTITNEQSENNSDEEIQWKKRIATLFSNKNEIKFLLDEEKPSIIANKFKQEAYNQYKIAGLDARIESITFQKPQNNEDFFDINLRIVSTQPESNFFIEYLYPVKDYVELYFFSDAIVKTTRYGENILVEGDNIFPYMKIKKISKIDNNKILVEVDISQKSFGGENFTYEYITNDLEQ